ncbi:MAG: hypothetical protein WAU88_13105 [Candidatus Zixiibacteriota bacterium]
MSAKYLKATIGAILIVTCALAGCAPSVKVIRPLSPELRVHRWHLDWAERIELVGKDGIPTRQADSVRTSKAAAFAADFISQVEDCLLERRLQSLDNPPFDVTVKLILFGQLRTSEASDPNYKYVVPPSIEIINGEVIKRPERTYKGKADWKDRIRVVQVIFIDELGTQLAEYKIAGDKLKPSGVAGRLAEWLDAVTEQ